MTLKSYISFLLALILVFAISAPSVMADTGAYSSEEAVLAHDFLTSVGVLPEGIIDTPDSTELTRGRFAAATVCLYGTPVIVSSATGGVFADVNSKTAFGAYIEAAQKLGLVSGSSTGNFEPDEKITLAQALKMIIHALGYENYATVYGGYPAGYINIAGRLKLTNGLNTDSSSYLTAADAIILLKNAANTELMQVDSVTGDGISLDIVNGETLLYKNHGIACIDGIAEANGYTSLYYTESELNPNQLMVGNRVFNDPTGRLQSILGLRVRLFYDYDNSHPVKEAKYASVLEENDIISLSPDDVSVLDSKVKYFEDENTEKTLAISPVASFILNGKLAALDLSQLLSFEKGSIELISNDGNKEIDLIKVTKYSSLFVNAVSISSGLIITTDGSQISLEADSDEYDFKIIKDGSPVTLSNVSQGDVILVAEGTGNGYRHIEVLASSKVLSGVVEECSEDYAVINGTSYFLDSSVASKVKCGVNYKLSLDAFDNISSVKAENDMVYGFLYGVAKQGLGNPMCRIFTENDRWVTLDFASRVKFNGTTVSADKLYADLTAMGDGYKQLIRYNVNELPQLTKLETHTVIPIGDDGEYQAELDDTFRLSFSGSATYRYTPKSFNGSFFVDSNTKVFYIPDTFAVDKFKVRTISSLNSDNSYKVNAYNVDEHLYSNVISTSSSFVDDGISYTDRFMIVKSVGEIMNIDGEAVPSIRGYRRGDVVAFPVDITDGAVEVDTLNSLKAGDVIHFNYDENNNIVFIKKYPVDSIYYTSANHYSSSVVIGAKVKNIDTNARHLRLVYTDGGDELGITYLTTTTAALWDANTQTCKEVDVSEIIPGDVIFANTRYHVCYDIVIIRN